ncbi:hypothetical protein [Streptomyces canus]|nr:hypothetical protein [Streptomyces canus]
MIPSQLAPVPQFVTTVEFDWAGTLKALIIPGGASMSFIKAPLSGLG